MVQPVTQDQVTEWTESPVTQLLLYVLKQQLDETYAERSELFIPGEPNRTQEIRANLIGQEAVYKDVIELASGETNELIEEYILEEWKTEAESTHQGTEY